MIRSLSIDGYRGFKHLEIEGLGRVNLLVGKNNCGKSSVLEAFYLLASAGDPTALWRILAQRGERVDGDVSRNRAGTDLDICHLFHGHEMEIGTSFELTAKNGHPARRLVYRIEKDSSRERAQEENPDLLPVGGEELLAPRVKLSLQGNPSPIVSRIALTRAGALNIEGVRFARLSHREVSSDESPARYIPSASLSPDELVTMWEMVSLTSWEDSVLEALKILDPRIERIASVSVVPSARLGARGGFKVKLKGVAKPLPIGSLGDGAWRILALAIALSQTENGVFLVDEIDTGLHYRVLSAMWKLLIETSKRLNIQIVATTHSLDCVNSLATICRDGVEADGEVALYRIERDEDAQGLAVSYTEDEILKLARYDIEAR